MKNTIRTSIIIAIIIVIGIIISALYRTTMEESNLLHKQINISIGKEVKSEDIINIAKEVFENKKVTVQKSGKYQDGVAINVKEITDEELESLNTKINEKYELKNTTQDLKITEIPKASTADYIKPYIKPLIISCIIIAVYVAIYFAISKHKN